MSTTIKVELLLSHGYDSFHNLHLPYREEGRSKKLEYVATKHLFAEPGVKHNAVFESKSGRKERQLSPCKAMFKTLQA